MTHKLSSVRLVCILAGVISATVIIGCGPLTDKQGKLDMDRVSQLIDKAEESEANVELDVRLRPGRAELTQGLAWNTGVEADFRLRWEGRPGKKEGGAP